MEEILDDLLRFLNKYFESIPFTARNVDSEIKSKPTEAIFHRNIEIADLINYIEYLVQKKYVDIYSNTKEGRDYKLNSIGKIFIQTGGFTRDKQDELSAIKYQRKVNFWLIAATILAAISPILTEIVKSKYFNDPVIINQPIHFILDSGAITTHSTDSIKISNIPIFREKQKEEKDSSK